MAKQAGKRTRNRPPTCSPRIALPSRSSALPTSASATRTVSRCEAGSLQPDRRADT